MSQYSLRGPGFLQLEEPGALIKLNDDSVADIAARGAVIEIQGRHFHVMPMGRLSDTPMMSCSENEPGPLGAALHEALCLRLGLLASAARDRAMSFARNTAPTVRGNNKPVVAFYGFREPRLHTRDHFRDLYPQGVPLFIDTLNQRIGVSVPLNNLDMRGVLDAIRETPQNQSGSLNVAWKQFQKDRLEQLDIFGMLAARAEQGMQPDDPWLAGYAHKNLSRDQRTLYFANPQAPAMLLEHARAFVSGEDVTDSGNNWNIVFNALAARAFVRKTCKLGLDFFKEKRIPVVFFWGNAMGKPFSPHDPDPGMGWQLMPGMDNLYKCYTLSEMHHVQKKGLDVYKVYA